MFVSSVDPTLLTDRLDAEHYEPTFVRSEQTVRNVPFGYSMLGAALDPSAPIVSGRVTRDGLGQPAEGSKVPNGVRLIRCTDIRDLSVDIDNVLCIERDVEAPYSRTRVVRGDVVVGIAGTVASVGLVPAGFRFANTNQSVARIRGRSHEVGYWIATFLSSAHGQAILLRRAVGGVQRHLNLADLPDVPLPLPCDAVMAYIGSKLRQAEALREMERNLTAACAHMVVDLFPGAGSGAGGRRISRTRPSQLVDRLNAEAYGPEHLRDVEVLRSAGLSLLPLGDLVTVPINNSIRGVTDALGNSDGEVPMFRPADIDGLWASTETAPLLPCAFESEHAKSRVIPGDIVLAIAGTVGTAGRVPPTVEYGNINGSSARLRPRADVSGYLLVLLNSPIGLRLTTRWAVGAVQKHLNLEDLPGILIPVAPEAVLRTLNEKVSSAESAHLHRRSLLLSARYLVEALIERKVTEAELAEAARDPGADRALLARMSTNGLDAPGRLLFPDLDAHGSLLASLGGPS